ncbi:uncharacterized protein LOC112045403 [Bicyclus anynana]|uniref:Uncharacterized protein LOC112045403 n=1 Tax=Bicyclus anynana TaxID=110368 RepID=A0A6J1MWU4_BICAN|nr:uncharacterized protein LOC112045403 [Bicyclus anynana]
MSKLTVTNFSNRTGSPYKNNKEEEVRTHEEVLQKTNTQKEKNNELLQKANKKTAEYQSNKPSSGVFTEVVAHGAFTTKKCEKEKSPKPDPSTTKANNANSSKSLLGFPSSANDLALDAKSDLESDPNISKEVKEKVIEKLFTLVSMVQHAYESKVRIMTEFDKYKDTHMKNELRREREHSEQLYKLNMNFQNEVIQSMQQLRSELDVTRSFSNNTHDTCAESFKDISLNYDSGVSTHTLNSHDNNINSDSLSKCD